MARLDVIASGAPDLRGKSVELPAPTDAESGFAIGRELGNDLVLPDESASRRHARIVGTGTGDAYELIDQGSGNGVWVNGDRVRRYRLVDGDLLRVGQTTFRFVAESAPSPPPATLPLCAYCGRELPPDARFCPSCGSPVPHPPIPIPTHLPGPPGRLPPPGPRPVFAAEVAPSPLSPEATLGAPLPPHSQPLSPPAPVYAAPAPRRTSGCAVGCCAVSLLLLVLTLAGSLLVLYRRGLLPFQVEASRSVPSTVSLLAPENEKEGGRSRPPLPAITY